MKKWGWMVTSVVAASLSAGPAAAEICDLKVYDAKEGRQLQEADAVFPLHGEFIVCVTPQKDGYLSLWDRMPKDGVAERLGPPEKHKAAEARKVSAGETECFGDGSAVEGVTPYKLLMETRDGFGQGRLWLVFSEKLEDHAGAETFDSFSMFDGAHERRFGAGAMGEKSSGRKTDRCSSTGTLGYDYAVVVKE